MQETKPGVFIAYPWSASMRAIYKELAKNLKENWNVYYGPYLKTEPPEQGEIEDFRNRNKQLFDRFAANIQASYIFIADITDLNANVMIELGIAIKLNKNILILSGAPSDKIPFDVSGLHVEYYRKPLEIKEKTKEFLNLYTKIKAMSFDTPVQGSYFEHLDPVIVQSSSESISNNASEGAYVIQSLPLKLPRMKDVKISVEYKIIEKSDESDWFGFLLRASEKQTGFEPIFSGSLLVNSRYTGSTNLVYYPGEKVLRSAKTHRAHDGNSYRKLVITLDGTKISVTGNEGQLEETKITISEFGHIYFACFRSKTEIKNLKVLNIDTITEIIS